MNDVFSIRISGRLETWIMPYKLYAVVIRFQLCMLYTQYKYCRLKVVFLLEKLPIHCVT